MVTIRPRRIDFVSAVEPLWGKTKARGRDFLKSLSLNSLGRSLPYPCAQHQDKNTFTLRVLYVSMVSF